MGEEAGRNITEGACNVREGAQGQATGPRGRERRRRGRRPGREIEQRTSSRTGRCHPASRCRCKQSKITLNVFLRTYLCGVARAVHARLAEPQLCPHQVSPHRIHGGRGARRPPLSRTSPAGVSVLHRGPKQGYCRERPPSNSRRSVRPVRPPTFPTCPPPTYLSARFFGKKRKKCLGSKMERFLSSSCF